MTIVGHDRKSCPAPVAVMDPFQRIINDALLKYPEPAGFSFKLEDWQLQVMASAAQINIESLKDQFNSLFEAMADVR